MKFTAGDICLHDPAISLDCMVVMEVEREGPEESYSCLSLKNGKMYTVSETRLIKIGAVSADLGPEGVTRILAQEPALPSVDDVEFLNGRARAKRELARGLPAQAERWRMLAEAKPGDTLQIYGRRGAESVKFHYVLERGEKYVFLAAKGDNKVYRYSLASLIVPTAPHA